MQCAHNAEVLSYLFTLMSCWPLTGHMLLGLNVSTCMCVSVHKFVLNVGAINHVSYACIDYVDIILIV